MFRRFHKWLGRFLGLAPAEPAQPRPEEILERCKEPFRKRIAAYDRALASRVAFCEVLRLQIAKVEAEKARLSAALEAQVKAPAPDPSAGELALRWEATGNEMAGLRTQLDAAERDRAELAAAREQAIQEARSQLAELKELLGHSRIAQALSELDREDKDTR